MVALPVDDAVDDAVDELEEAAYIFADVMWGRYYTLLVVMNLLSYFSSVDSFDSESWVLAYND